jgi:hypothetical protein
MRISRNVYVSGAAVATLLVCIGATTAYIAAGRAESRSSVVTEALDVRPAESDVVATVNGVPIYAAGVDAARMLLSVFPAQELSFDDEAGILEYTIDQELLHQEAARRDIVVADAELTEFVSAIVSQIVAARADGTLPSDIAAIVEGIEDAGHSLEGWSESAPVRDAYGRMLVLGRLALDETGSIGPGPERDRLVREAMERLMRELRSQAEIEYTVRP